MPTWKHICHAQDAAAAVHVCVGVCSSAASGAASYGGCVTGVRVCDGDLQKSHCCMAINAPFEGPAARVQAIITCRSSAHVLLGFSAWGLFEASSPGHTTDLLVAWIAKYQI